jgi:iron(III) transport system permease protein
MAQAQPLPLPSAESRRIGRPSTGLLAMSLIILGLGFYILYPLLLIFINSFNVARIGEPARYGLDNWTAAFAGAGIFQSIWNTIFIYVCYMSVAFPMAVLIAWLLARCRIPWAGGLEVMFWVSYMLPGLFTTIGWMMLIDPDLGLLNVALKTWVPFIKESPFNIYTVQGIIWAHLVSTAISTKVMLLTPSFRNMDVSFEEASRASGASNWVTMARVTLPLMIPAMTIVFMLNIVRMFQTFEIEQLIGTPFNFFVYSTKIYNLARASEPPQYGQATALASITLVLIFLIIPIQRWLLHRRDTTTVGSKFRPGLVDLGPWRWLAFGFIAMVLIVLNIVPLITVILGSFMTRAGFFQINPMFTMKHWEVVLGDNQFRQALFNTFFISGFTAILSPLLFSIIAYILVRTRWPGRGLLDGIIWGSAAIPGILASLGLLWAFLGTPFLRPLYGTLWALVLVAILQGKLTAIQINKATFLQLGQDLEDAARASGGNWWSVYWRIWIPLMLPTLILVGTLHFVVTAQSTSYVVMLASKETKTLSLLALEFASGGVTMREEAGIIGLFIVIMTLGVALIARAFGMKVGIRH